MNKKIKKFFLILIIIVVNFNSVFASTSDLINLGIFDKSYISSSVSKEKLLPFINMFSENATYDTNLKSSGVSISGKSINVDKNLQGTQIISASDTVTISGEVEYAKIIATNVIIKGKISKDVLILAKSVFITETASIGNDAIIFAGKVEMRGNVSGSLIVSTGDFYLSGNVGRDLRIKVAGTAINTNNSKNQNILKLENEKIAGNIFIETNMDTTAIKAKYPNATIKVIIQKTTVVKKQNISKLITKGILTALMYTFVYVIISKKKNNTLNKITEKIKTHLVLSSCIGLVLISLIPVICTLLFVLGILGLGPVAWPMLIAYVASVTLIFMTSTLIVGLVITDFVVGKIVEDNNKKIKVLTITFGIFATLYMLTVLPIISNYAGMLYILLALGIMFTAIFIKTKEIPKEENKTIKANK